MTRVTVQEAKPRLSQLLAAAERGEEVVIARGGRPVVRLVPVDAPAPRPGGVVGGAAAERRGRGHRAGGPAGGAPGAGRRARAPPCRLCGGGRPRGLLRSVAGRRTGP